MRSPLRSLSSVFPLCAAAALSIACAEAPDGDDATAAAVVDGELSPASEDAVVVIGVPRGRCTGVLVGEKVVATAFHCVVREGVAARGCGPGRVDLPEPAPPSAFAVGVGSPPEPVRRYSVVDVVVGAGRSMCNGDVALLVLDRAVEGVAPRALREEPLRVSDSVRVVGWGLTEVGSYAGRRLARDGVRVMGVGGGVVQQSAPQPGRASRLLAFGDREFVTSEGPCLGDSGGPTFDADGRVVGILSRVLGEAPATGVGCRGAIAAHSLLSANRDLLEEASRRAR